MRRISGRPRAAAAGAPVLALLLLLLLLREGACITDPRCLPCNPRGMCCGEFVVDICGSDRECTAWTNWVRLCQQTCISRK